MSPRRVRYPRWSAAACLAGCLAVGVVGVPALGVSVGDGSEGLGRGGVGAPAAVHDRSVVESGAGAVIGAGSESGGEPGEGAALERDAGGAAGSDEAGGAESSRSALVSARESLPLGASLDGDRGAPASGGGAVGGDGFFGHWAFRTGGALAIVIALALVLRSLARAVAGHAGGIRGQLGAGGRAPSGVLGVLGRFPIARGQTLVLLRVDRRVLLLSQTPAGFGTLTEIVDPEEVASIVGKCEAGARSGDDGGFQGVMRALERDPSVARGPMSGDRFATGDRFARSGAGSGAGVGAGMGAGGGGDSGGRDATAHAMSILDAPRRASGARGGGGGAIA
ncbi:MAG: flagellar biosynthetic protein FliO [Phycisphaerales bacterium]